MAFLTALNWGNMLIMAIGSFIALLVIARTERKYLWMSVLFFSAPLCGALALFGWLRESLPEFAIALVLGLVLYNIYFRVYGHKLTPPDSSNIKVWGQDD